MTRKLISGACATLAAAAAAAAPVALAAGPAAGVYKGKINQTDLFKGHYATITFTVRKGAIIKLGVKNLAVNCTDGNAGTTNYSPPAGRIRIRKGGAFSYVHKTKTLDFEIKGTVRGRKATGKVFNEFVDPGSGATCTTFFTEPFTARH